MAARRLFSIDLEGIFCLGFAVGIGDAMSFSSIVSGAQSHMLEERKHSGRKGIDPLPQHWSPRTQCIFYRCYLDRKRRPSLARDKRQPPESPSCDEAGLDILNTTGGLWYYICTLCVRIVSACRGTGRREPTRTRNPCHGEEVPRV